MFRSAGVFILTGLLVACSARTVLEDGSGAIAPRVTGTITYRQRIALPADAVIKVQLVDVSRQDVPGITISELTIYPNGRQVPFEFQIDYRPAQIDAGHTYSLQASIAFHGRTRFLNDRPYAVLTRGAPAHVDMVLRAVE